MCGRFNLITDIRSVARRFGLAAPPDAAAWRPRFNIAPTQTVIIVADDGTRRLERMRWGLIPSWASDPGIGNKLINARSETLTERPSFRTALRRRRCLIPADGFYEWPAVPGGRGKQPTRIVLRSREVFAFAGLWESWAAPDGQAIRSCTIITCPPNELMATMHHRMPVILTREAEDTWLDPRIEDPGLLLPLLRPYPADQMECYPVSRLVNNPANDSPQLILPLEQE